MSLYLIVALTLAGVLIPKSLLHAHEVACDGSDHCLGAIVVPCDLGTDCHGEPAEPECPCDHSDESPLAEEHSPSEQGPSHSHEHHHHQCVCSASSPWFISDSETLSLHPPLREARRFSGDLLNQPEDPVFLLDRPPIG